MQNIKVITKCEFNVECIKKAFELLNIISITLLTYNEKENMYNYISIYSFEDIINIDVKHIGFIFVVGSFKEEKLMIFFDFTCDNVIIKVNSDNSKINKLFLKKIC